MIEKYQVLARRYRPQRFSDVVGQQAVLQTLKHAIERNTVAHAYLFAGARGIGKTTLARLFAKALNCKARGPTQEPCNQCPSCLDIASAQSFDVIEIDGASNRGIDDIRKINETVGFAPSFGQYKIYIIDEVHMLTKEAFNALLKTLEEPPERVKFFFATTEVHKVLPTILSRCQRFDLGRLLPSQIAAKLESIAKDLARAIEPEALHLIAMAADGSLRDAESLLDQVLCFSNGPVSAEEARGALGLASHELLFSLDQAFAKSNLAYAFELVDHLFQSGKDFGHFLEQLIEHYRHLTVCKTLSPQALHMPDTIAAKYAESAALYTQTQCLGILDILLKADVQLAKSPSPRTSLELALLQILRTKHRIPIEVLVRRLSDLEESLLQSPAAAATAPQVASEAQSEPPPPQPVVIDVPAPAPMPPPALAPPDKHPSHYETLIRFAAVELEGTVKK